jgi:hypothetical protein
MALWAGLGTVTENSAPQHPTINWIFFCQNCVSSKFQSDIRNQYRIPRLMMLDLLKSEKKKISIVLGSPTGAQWTVKNESRLSTEKST